VSAASTITITLPNGEARPYAAGITALEIAQGISKSLAEKTLAAEVNGQVVEITRPLTTDATLRLLTWDDDGGRSTFWHSSAHLLAEAIEHFYPGVKFGIGPPIEEGFYYDIDFGDRKFTEEDFKKIEQKFLELAKSGETFVRKPVAKADAVAYFTQKGDHLKLDLLKDLEDGSITFYESGNFVDLCRGPHLADSRAVKSVKLLTIAGAYWRGDSKNQQLTRIYGITFPKPKDLEEYLVRLEEARKRDHRRVGKEMDMFSFHEEGPGFPFWHHNGMVVMMGLQDYLRRILTRDYGYQEIRTPVILNQVLWEKSGHFQNYAENMYFTDIDEQGFAVKPMNCPGSTLVYGTHLHSYRDLPLRLFEFGLVHRHEASGALNGLFRVRAFTQDDAHVFCTPEQIEGEIQVLIRLFFHIYSLFDLTDVDVFLSTRPEKSMGSDEIWNTAEASLQSALDGAGIKYQINPGDGAFYGPKIDFVVRDSLRRKWQLGTIQLDFSMPGRFGLEYIGADGQKHTPVMIHRAILGSFERFIGVLIEHTAGKFPLWLAPQQALVLSISEKYNGYGHSIIAELKKQGLRAALDDRDERISRKIRDAEVAKVPYMLVIGEKEAAEGTVTLRRQGEGDLGQFPLAEAIRLLNQAVEASQHVPASSTATATA
jgi:threonyl-tRNA synthetase